MPCGATEGGLLAFQMTPDAMPEPEPSDLRPVCASLTHQVGLTANGRLNQVTRLLLDCTSTPNPLQLSNNVSQPKPV